MQSTSIVLLTILAIAAVAAYRLGFEARPLDEAIVIGLVVGLLIHLAGRIDELRGQVAAPQRRLGETDLDAT